MSRCATARRRRAISVTSSSCVFNADNRHFSITLAVPEIESGLRTAVMKPEVFDAICAEIPGCARWTDPARSEPVSIVYAMGNLKSVWRQYSRAGKPQVLNFFALGDAAVRTNPLYGRGCSAGVVHAHILRATLDATRDPAERAAKFESETRAAIRPFYDTMAQQDAQAIRRAANERNPAYVPSRRAKLAKSFIEDAIGPATRGDVTVLRAFSRAFHMLDDPRGWMKQTRHYGARAGDLGAAQSDQAGAWALSAELRAEARRDARQAEHRRIANPGDADGVLSRTEDDQDQRHRHGRL